MPASIGFRAYQILLSRRQSSKALPFDDEGVATPVGRFVSKFIKANVASNLEEEAERSWYFEPKSNDRNGNSKGYLRYGTFGFESDFVDTVTKNTNYHRQVQDVEEIPLFYEFWFPDDDDFALVAFQSFQGRSCINMVMSRMQSDFEAANSGYAIRFRKLMPNDLGGGLYSSAPVKKVRFIKRNTSADFADRYLGRTDTGSIDVELSIVARRRGYLGVLGEVSRSLRRAPGLASYEGIEFPEAVAEIKVGNKIRRVGVLGLSGDAGLIDLTDEIKRGPDGHPTFRSMSEKSDEILTDFEKVLTGKGT